MNYRFIKLTVLIYCLFSISCSQKKFEVESDADGRSTIIINGITRSFTIKVPKNYDSNLDYSLMFYLHAAGESASAVLNRGYTEKAHDLNFIIVYPNGLAGNWKLYNDTENGSSDVIFISTLIDYIDNKYSIDRHRIYSAGRSLGGFMSYKLAFDLPKDIAGISVISGSVFPESLPTKDKALSVQHIHALDDPHISFNITTDQVLSIPQCIDYWMKVNNSENKSQIFYNQNGILGKRWNSNRTNKTIELITYDKGGHSPLPSTYEFVLDFFNNI